MQGNAGKTDTSKVGAGVREDAAQKKMVIVEKQR